MFGKRVGPGSRSAWIAVMGLAFGLHIGAAVAAPATITCSSDPNIFNTAFNGSTGVLANNDKDAHWEVTDMQPKASPIPSAPPAGVTWFPAVVGNAASFAWNAPPYTTANWISREFGTSLSGDWYYRYQFNLDPSVDASQFVLNMGFMADNSIAEVYVNGVAQSTKISGLPQVALAGSYVYGGFVLAHQANLTLNHDWKTGLNELVVLVHSDLDYEGFAAYITAPPVCRAAPISSPAAVPTLTTWSLALLAMVLGSFGWRVGRQR